MSGLPVSARSNFLANRVDANRAGITIVLRIATSYRHASSPRQVSTEPRAGALTTHRLTRILPRKEDARLCSKTSPLTQPGDRLGVFSAPPSGCENLSERQRIKPRPPAKVPPSLENFPSRGQSSIKR